MKCGYYRTSFTTWCTAASIATSVTTGVAASVAAIGITTVGIATIDFTTSVIYASDRDAHDCVSTHEVEVVNTSLTWVSSNDAVFVFMQVLTATTTRRNPVVSIHYVNFCTSIVWNGLQIEGISTCW